MIKLCSLAQLTFKKGKLSAWAWPNHMSPLKLGGGVRDTRSQSAVCHSGLSMKGAKRQQLQAAFRSWEPQLWPAIARNWILPTTWMSLEADFSPAPADENWPSWHLGFSPVILRTQPRCPCWTFDQWNCKLISGCCFKLLSVSHSSRKLIC